MKTPPAVCDPRRRLCPASKERTMIKQCEWCGADYSLQPHTASKRMFCSLKCVGLKNKRVHGAGDLLARTRAGENGCLEWTGRTDKQGYGVTFYNGSRRLVHRVVFADTHHVKLSLSNVVMHSCDNRICINPDHLSVGTQQDNLRDMVNKGRHAKRSAHGMSILSEEDVASIKIAPDVSTNTEIAKRFGVSASHVSRIRSGKRW